MNFVKHLLGMIDKRRMSALKKVVDISKFKKESGIFLVSDIPGEQISFPDEGYDACFGVEDNSFWFSHRNRCIISAIKKYCPNCIFFDVGGGNGYVSQGLQKEGIETVLVEPGLKGCLNARKRKVENILNMTCDKVDFKTEKQELAFGFFDVIEHIENDYRFLDEIFQRVPSGTKFFITVPAYNWLWSQDDIVAGHHRRYNKSSLTNLTSKLGMKLVFSTYFFSFLPLPIFLLRRLPFLFNRPLSLEQAEKKVGSDHSAGDSAIKKAVISALRFEQLGIEKGISLPFGGSLLHIVEKV